MKIDFYLHLGASLVLLFAFSYFFGIKKAIILTILLQLGKEAFDFAFKGGDVDVTDFVGDALAFVPYLLTVKFSKMKFLKVLAILALAMPGTAQTSRSVSATAQFQFGKPAIGVSAIMEERPVTFQGHVLANSEGVAEIDVKMGFRFFSEGGHRFVFYPFYLNAVSNPARYNTPLGLAWIYTRNETTFNVGADFTWNGDGATWSPNVSVNYRLWGSRYLPKSAVIEGGKIQTFFGWADVVAWTASGLGGALMGLREAQHADPKVFERPCSETSFFICGKSAAGFWGSEQWRRKYHGGDPANGKKSEFFGNFGRDSWHTFDKLQRAGLVLGVTLPLMQQKRPLKQRILNSFISLGFYSLMYSRAYNIRYI